ncbi:hypothetical protein GCM10009846_11470 [Agrococcus versicolor]|uniref:Gram-positive cocci surface proteins LPxTG domain-containing protein n=1 Tax=Agrococcus versicolor TaxID=501482 RepID=A0ABN3APH5_9MICO
MAAQTAVAAPPDTVDIRVEIDLTDPSGASQRQGAAVFEVQDATIGAGSELDATDLVANPSGWCGSLQVDVDTAASPMTIAVSPDAPCDFTDVRVQVAAAGICPVTLVEDALFGGDSSQFALTTTCTDDVLSATWALVQPGSGSFNFTGTTTFSFVDAPDPEPSPSPDPEPSPSTDPEPSASADPEPSASADPEPSPSTDPEPSASAGPSASAAPSAPPAGTTPNEAAPAQSAVAPAPTTSAAPSAAADERLPQTGAAHEPLVVVAAVLVLLAGAALLLARRRSHA